MQLFVIHTRLAMQKLKFSVQYMNQLNMVESELKIQRSLQEIWDLILLILYTQWYTQSTVLTKKSVKVPTQA